MGAGARHDLGSLDESDGLIDPDDDGNPLSDGLASALNGRVNSDGSVWLKGSDFGEYDFDRFDDVSPTTGDPQGSEDDYAVEVRFDSLLFRDPQGTASDGGIGMGSGKAGQDPS